MAAEWLLHEGRPIADISVLSHPEQLARLAKACPQAVPTAVLCGDPCFDRLLEAAARRERHRSALKLEPGQRLLVVNSTWNPGSLFGDATDVLPLLLERIAAELPLDEYRVAAILHPNIWYGHGTGQIRAWLRRAERAGMLLVPPLDGWRQTLAAADILIGDHGSVSYYAAAIGVPVLLGAFPADDLDPGSPVAEFGRIADRLDHDSPLRPQLDAALDAAIAEHDPDRFARITEWTTSDPGRSAELLRALFYRVLGIEEPSFPARFDSLAPSKLAFAPPASAVRALVHRAGDDAETLRVERYPEYAGPTERSDAAHVHLAVRDDCADFTALSRADLALTYAPDNPQDAVAQLGREHQHASMVADCSTPGRAVAKYYSGSVYEIECLTCRCDPAPLVSALLAGLNNGSSIARAPDGATVLPGAIARRVRVTRRP